VEELKASTVQMSSHLRRIDAVEKELELLRSKNASKEEVESVRSAMKQADVSRVSFWGVQAYASLQDSREFAAAGFTGDLIASRSQGGPDGLQGSRVG
jgi:hypothetical protein